MSLYQVGVRRQSAILVPLTGFEPVLSRLSTVSLCLVGVQRQVHVGAPEAIRTLTDAGLSRDPLPGWDTRASPLFNCPLVGTGGLEPPSPGYQPGPLPLR